MLLLFLFPEIFIKTWPRFVGKPHLSTNPVCVAFLMRVNGTTVPPLFWIRKLSIPGPHPFPLSLYARDTEVCSVLVLDSSFKQLPLHLDSYSPHLNLNPVSLVSAPACSHSSVILYLGAVPPPHRSGQFVIIPLEAAQMMTPLRIFCPPSQLLVTLPLRTHST